MAAGADPTHRQAGSENGLVPDSVPSFYFTITGGDDARKEDFNDARNYLLKGFEERISERDKWFFRPNGNSDSRIGL